MILCDFMRNNHFVMGVDILKNTPETFKNTEAHHHDIKKHSPEKQCGFSQNYSHTQFTAFKETCRIGEQRTRFRTNKFTDRNLIIVSYATAKIKLSREPVPWCNATQGMVGDGCPHKLGVGDPWSQATFHRSDP